MRIANGMAHPLTGKVPGRPPVIVNQGKEEFRFASPTRTLPKLSVVNLKDEEADSLFKQFGRLGLLLVRDPDMTDAEALVEAKAKRMEFLEETMNYFREVNAQRRATNLEVLIPRRRHREMLKELQGLRKELAEANKELYEGVVAKAAQQAQDVSLDGLEEFGITTGNTPLSPGLSDAEALGGR